MVFKPYKLWVSKAGEVDVDEAKFEITNVSDADLDISVVGQPPGYFVMDVPKSVKAGGTVNCSVKVNQEYLASAFEKSVTFELSDAARTRFTIPVVRRFIGSQNIDKSPQANPQEGGGH